MCYALACNVCYSFDYRILFPYVSQVYPTTTRALGLGSCSGMARVGAIVTPFIAQVRKLDQNHF